MNLKINRYLAFITTIIFFNLQCFYLVDASKIPTSDIAVLLEAAFMVYVYCKCKCNRKGKFSLIFTVPIILVLTSACAAYKNYGQPLYLGIRAQRHWLMAMLMYFPLNRLIISKKLQVKQLFNLLDKIVFVYSTLIIIQYLLGNSFLFMHVKNNMRYGSIRLYVSTSFLTISYFYHLKLILDGKKIVGKDAFVILITIFIYLFVTKSRMALVVLAGTTSIAILSFKMTKRKLIYISIAIIGACTFLPTSMGQTIIDSIFGATSIDAGTVIRDVGRAFYMEKTLSTPLTALFGSGYANLDWGPTVTGIRYLEGINYNDNGIIGLFFYYGFAFVAWMLFSHIKIMKNAWKYEHKDIFFYLLCGLMGIYTLFPYCYVTDISFATVCAIVAGTQKNEHNRKINHYTN